MFSEWSIRLAVMKNAGDRSLPSRLNLTETLNHRLGLDGRRVLEKTGKPPHFLGQKDGIQDELFHGKTDVA